jgi:hypothetical protein
MDEIAREIPDPEKLAALTPKQLGAKLLLKARVRFGKKEFHPGNLMLELWPQSSFPSQRSRYPLHLRTEVDQIFSEAWAWLENNGWMVPYQSAGPGWKKLSRRAQGITSEDEVTRDANPRSGPTQPNMIDVSVLGSTIGQPVIRNTDISRKVFVVHGHDEGPRETVARFLERLDFEPIILHEQPSRGRTVIEKVEAHSDVGFAVVLLTPDDEGCEKGSKPRPRARQNVVLELGYFVGRLGRDHVCALRRGDDLEIPSDFGGVVYVPFDNSDGWKQTLGRELEAAGLRIDWNKAMGSRT